MDLEDITDNKKDFGSKIIFSDKIKTTDFINLEENGKILSNDKEIEGFSTNFCEYST